jgi:hypothetical protein
MSMMDWTGVDFTGLYAAPTGNDVSSISDLYNSVGGRVTGAVQQYIDEVYAGAQSGKYSISDAQNAFNIVNEQAGQGMTGAYGAAQGVVAVAPSGSSTPTESTGSTGSKDALSTINGILSRFGLGALAGQLWNMHLNKEVDITSEDAIAWVLKETPAWKERFAGNISRVAAGYEELSPSTYIGMEEMYKSVLKANGMPTGFYDNQEALNSLIAGDIDAQEFNDRIGFARSIVHDAPASVRAQMQELYGISEGMLVAHFIDPKQADPLLKEQERTARIGAASIERAGMQLTKEQATDLAKRGYTEEQAKTGFSDVASLGELTQTARGEESVTRDEIIGASFGYNTDAQKKLQKKQRRRVSEFEGGGSFASSQGVGGTVKTGVGGPE